MQTANSLLSATGNGPAEGMYSYSKHVGAPGSVPVNVIYAIHKAILKIPRVSYPADLGGQYFAKARQKISDMSPSVRGVFGVPTYQARTGLPFKAETYETSQGKARRVKRELIDAGVTFYGLMKSESKVLPKLMHNDEHIEAVVYGQHRSSSVMLVATTERILFVDKKPMALFLDEVSYEVISGIELEIHTLFATLTLHTPVKNYDIRYANLHCSERFARHIEGQRLEREKKHEELQGGMQGSAGTTGTSPNQPIEDMAGYYWLPNDEEERRRLQESIL